MNPGRAPVSGLERVIGNACKGFKPYRTVTSTRQPFGMPASSPTSTNRRNHTTTTLRARGFPHARRTSRAATPSIHRYAARIVGRSPGVSKPISWPSLPATAVKPRQPQQPRRVSQRPSALWRHGAQSGWSMASRPVFPKWPPPDFDFENVVRVRLRC